MKVGQNSDKKKVLEELLELGMVLVAIDARAQGVDVPNHLGVDPQLRLNLSWRFGRPMEVDGWGIRAELTFGGVPYGCTFPWDAIFLIVSHVNGESYLFPDHVPKELLHQAAGEHVEEVQHQARAKAHGRPKLSLVPTGAADEDAEAQSGADAASGTEAEPEPAPARRARAPQRTKAPAAPAADGEGAPSTPAVAPAEGTADADGAPNASPTDDAPHKPQKSARSRGHLRLIK